MYTDEAIQAFVDAEEIFPERRKVRGWRGEGKRMSKEEEEDEEWRG